MPAMQLTRNDDRGEPTKRDQTALAAEMLWITFDTDLLGEINLCRIRQPPVHYSG